MQSGPKAKIKTGVANYAGVIQVVDTLIVAGTTWLPFGSCARMG